MPIHTENLEALFAQCDREPVNTPGAIQQFGILLTVDPLQLIIRNASENTAQLWCRPVAGLVGRSISEVLSQPDVERLRDYVNQANLEELSPLTVRLAGEDEGVAAEWTVRAHHHVGMVFLEFEPARVVQPETIGTAFHTRVRDAVHSLQAAHGVRDLCSRAVQQVRQITGFDRVMVYRFDADWHGEVIAEECAPGVDAYLGHHFPAADIPAPAREIFIRNWVRMIPDVDYEPVRIHPAEHPDSGQPLDLGRTLLRSVSPIHLEYLRNMQVRASLTVSLLDEGKLWGLIACHHTTPLLIDVDTRAAAELIGRMVSAQLHVKQAAEESTARAQLDQAVSAMLAQFEREPDIADAVAGHAGQLCDMLQAGGVAVRYDGAWTVSGATPPVSQLDRLHAWIKGIGASPVVYTERLSHRFPEAAGYKEQASGVLAAFLSRAEGNCVLWFRPEVDMTMTWAGKPQKSTLRDGPLASLHPRTSFAAWKEQVTGTAMPWTSAEIDAVERLRIGLLAIALDHEHAREQAARQRAERLSREKDEMVMMVSHDLKTPLNVISLSLEFIKQAHPSEEPPVQRMFERGERAVGMMTMLITNILDVAKIEAGTLSLQLNAEDPVALVWEVADVAMPLAAQKGVQLTLQAPEAAAAVSCERFRIVQVLNNLVSNALKFTPAGGQIKVALEEQDNDVLFSVTDTGTGIEDKHLARIFDRFWQRDDESRRGTGLGLWIAKAIVEVHGGVISAASEPGQGSTFRFTLKKAGSR